MKFTESLHVPWYVVVTSVMVVLVCILRIISYLVEGQNDEVLSEVLTAVLALFTGSIAAARAVSNVNGNGDGDIKEK